jgi:hypothetical protein
VLQSDVARHSHAAVRGLVRGWRKVLMAHLISLAAREDAHIHLVRSVDVQRACHPRYVPARLPELWHEVYEGTAAFFGMRLVRSAVPLNVQIMRGLPRVFTDSFYGLPGPACTHGFPRRS